MRHNKTVNHLGRQAGHRKALLSNLAASLIMHKRIETTLAKAKALRTYVEPLITKSKAANNQTINTIVKKVRIKKEDGTVEEKEKTIHENSSTHARRVVFSYLKNKDAVKELFGVVAPKISERKGGYTRILKLGFRPGDAAETALIELVDFSQELATGAVATTTAAAAKPETKKTTTRRSRKKSDKKDSAETTEKPKAKKASKKADKAE